MPGIKIIPTVNSVSPSAEQIAADTVDGFHASQTAGANEIPVKDSSDNLTIASGDLKLTAGHIQLEGNTKYIKFTPTSGYTGIGSVGVSRLDLYAGPANEVRLSITQTGNVLIETTTDAGTGKLQVNGDISTTLGYKVNGTQVLYARVIDARIDDTINTSAWDATTAGVLDAIRDALVTHGIVAAS